MNKQPMTFYIKAIAACPECGYTQECFLGKDRVIYHECNQGNVATPVPAVIKRPVRRSHGI